MVVHQTELVDWVRSSYLHHHASPDVSGDITNRLPICGPITNAKQGSLLKRLSALDSMMSSLIDQVKTIQSEVKHIGESVHTLAKVA